MTAATVPASAPGGLAQRLPAWIQHNVVGLVVTAAVSGAVGYIVNVWLMAVRYEGSQTAEGAPAMSEGNVFVGSIFWAMFPAVACSAIGYRRAVGKERFWRDVRRLPIVLVGLFRRDGSQGWVHLLWGAAIALAATLVVPPAVGAVLGVGLLIGAPTIVGSVLSTAFAQLWRLVARIVAPTKDHRVAPILKVAVGILGWAIALVLGFVLPGTWIRLVLALGCGAVAFLLGKRATAASVVVTGAVLVFGYVVVDILRAASALADDGGFAECGSTLKAWIESCSGAGEIRRRAVLGAVVGAPGGGVGFVGGGVIGLLSVQSGGGPWWDRFGLDELPSGMLDPATGESLVVNDGRWAEAPAGHVYFQGQWAHPESVGAIPDLDDPFTPDADDEDPLLRPELWVPPLVAAAVAGASSASGQSASSRSSARSEARRRRSEGAEPDGGGDAAAAGAGGSGAVPIADTGGGAGGAGGGGGGGEPEPQPVELAPAPTAAEAAQADTLLQEADAIRNELAAATTDADRARLHTTLRNKALEIADHPAARQAVAADTTGLQTAISEELQARDTEVMGVFVERMNELGVTRGGQPLDTGDIDDLRQRTAQHRPQVSPGNVGKLWKGYGSKKGKLAIDAATYLRFLEGRRDDPETTEEDRATLERKIERLQHHIDEGVESVMVSEKIWNEVAQFAYDQAIGGTV